jgi:hypothetical protein
VISATNKRIMPLYQKNKKDNASVVPKKKDITFTNIMDISHG